MKLLAADVSPLVACSPDVVTLAPLVVLTPDGSKTRGGPIGTGRIELDELLCPGRESWLTMNLPDCSGTRIGTNRESHTGSQLCKRGGAGGAW